MKNHPLVEAIFKNQHDHELKHLKSAHNALIEAQMAMDDAMIARESRVAKGATDDVAYGRAVEKALRYSAWMMSDYITEVNRRKK